MAMRMKKNTISRTRKKKRNNLYKVEAKRKNLRFQIFSPSRKV